MPLPGAQHTSIANPFEETEKRISVYTAQEIATLQSRLEKQLGPEYISSRTGPSGQKVHYISAEKCISLANEVFGFNGWSSSIQNIQVDFVEENPQTLKVSLGLSVIVRVTLRDGTFHEDIGYGHIENCKGKAAAFEKAKKEGTTDALKRALRNFGNVLGNCIYDKAYLAKVTKMKIEPTKLDELSLHRHSDFAVKLESTDRPNHSSAGHAKTRNPELPKTNNTGPRSESNEASLLSSDSFEEFMSELDEADFTVVEDGHPDEIVLPIPQTNSSDKPPGGQQQGNATAMQPPTRPILKPAAAASHPARPPQTPNQFPSRAGQFNGQSYQHHQGNTGPRPQPQASTNQGVGTLNSGNQANSSGHNSGRPGPQNAQNAACVPSPSSESAGFFSARAVSQLPEDVLNSQQVVPKANQAFNLHAESPSIRKTPGIDHTKSKPVGKNGQHIAPQSSADNTANVPSRPLVISTSGQGPVQRPGSVGPGSRGNLVNPQLDHGRRIGAPIGGASPLANRGQYRPPTMKRPAGQDTNAVSQGPSRPPLAEMPKNNVATSNPGTGPDSKRQRVA